MSKENIIWCTIVVYIIIMAVVAFTAGKKQASMADLTVGGRSAGAWLSALSYGTAYFSAVMFVGYAGGTGLGFRLWGILAGIGNAIFGSWLAWALLARRTRDISARLKIKSMPEMFEKRYNSKAMKIFSSIVMFIFLIPYSASVYKGLASVAEVLLGIDVTICMLIIAAVATLLLLFGGYMVQARADFVQGIVMMFGITLLIIFVIRCETVGGIQGIIEYATPDKGLPKLTANQWISLWATVLMTSFGTWGLPQMIQKYFGIKDDQQAKRGITISTIFALLIAGGGYFIGSLCWMFFDESTMPAKDYIVPRMLEMANLPTVLLGIIIVLLISASVSTLCSITLTSSSIFTLDLVKPTIQKNMSDKDASILTKFIIVIFIITSFIVANTDTPILEMMSYSWGVISGSFLAPYVVMLFYKGTNKIGAWASILVGFFIAIIPAACRIITLTQGDKTAKAIVDLAAKGPLYACIAMIVSILVCIAVSYCTQAKVNHNTEFFYTGVVKSE